MPLLKAARVAAHSDRDPRRVDDLLGGKIGAEAKPQAKALQDRPGPIHAALIGSDTCVAVGITTRGSSPVLALCRALVAAGHNPDSRLEVYRGDVLALTVRSIGLAARLEIASHGVGFQAARGCGAASPMRQTGSPLRRVRP